MNVQLNNNNPRYFSFLNKLRISIKHVLYNNVFHNFTTLQAGIITAHFRDRENNIKRSSFTESLSFDAFNGQKARGNRINSREYHAENCGVEIPNSECVQSFTLFEKETKERSFIY